MVHSLGAAVTRGSVMSLKTALYSALANDCVTMAVANPEYYEEGDDEWDVEPTGKVSEIMAWWGQSDDFTIVFKDAKGVTLGIWIIYQGEEGVDWMQDCDTGDWTERVTQGHEVEPS